MTLHPEVKKFLSEAGKKGGASKSKNKTDKSRDNGKLGGRPKNARSKKSIK